ncbi:MAG: phosphate ABC transporter substrate-binding protein [Syntrophomonas sp.]|uniref:phosphate ABC transporter substrate-binding protein n=1 Tax=Syntrophomonas sp. TaxID=2053627 RepID=UPI002636A214|nr:phosphate ABC transporter substrate-binding protein [Syntrophomonas sp.]MDD4627549.1 phosphate ABC transporter substrate-binding protein [Syntrophomonas sp.]
MYSEKLRRVGSFLILGLLLLALVFTSACSKSESEAESGVKNEVKGKLQGSITIAGSTSVQPFSEVLAEEFQKKTPGVKINVQGGGSSQGIETAISGAADIGASSRKLKDEEKKAGLKETLIALDAIAIVVHPSNQLNELKMEDLRNIYLGNIVNWKELGGADTPISIVCREEGSGTRGAFEEIVMNKQDIFAKSLIQNSTGAVRTTVAGDKNAIGFVSLAAVDQDVKALKIDGVLPAVDNVKNGSYKISRPFIYLTRAASDNKIADAFIEFVLSDEGQSILGNEGAISIK